MCSTFGFAESYFIRRSFPQDRLGRGRGSLFILQAQMPRSYCGVSKICWRFTCRGRNVRGKAYFTIAIGCTLAGRHRSVAMTVDTFSIDSRVAIRLRLRHRELGRAPERNSHESAHPVVIVTHGKAGADMLDAVQRFLGMHLQDVATVGVEPEDDRRAVDGKIGEAVARPDCLPARMWLFLVDLSWLDARSLCCSRCDGRSGHVVTGVNLPMLLCPATADRATGPERLGGVLVATGTKSIHCE